MRLYVFGYSTNGCPKNNETFRIIVSVRIVFAPRSSYLWVDEKAKPISLTTMETQRKSYSVGFKIKAVKLISPLKNSPSPTIKFEKY